MTSLSKLPWRRHSMNIEEEIYAELVKRFGVGETCIKKWRTRKEITWLQFINASMKLSGVELYNFCGFSASAAFSTFFKREHRAIFLLKNKQHWSNYLLSLVDKKKCYSCKNILSKTEFDLNKSRPDGLQHKCRHCSIEYTEDNKEQITSRHKKYYIINKESLNLSSRQYYHSNKYLYTARNARRRAAKLQATPNWADHETIKRIYETCPEGYHVDHIIPLQNDLVCGLHCEFNLQHLTATENLSKGNKFNI